MEIEKKREVIVHGSILLALEFTNHDQNNDLAEDNLGLLDVFFLLALTTLQAMYLKSGRR